MQREEVDVVSIFGEKRTMLAVTRKERGNKTPIFSSFGFLDLRRLQLLSQTVNNAGLLFSKARFKFTDQRGQLDFNTLLLRVIGRETHLLDADLASSQLLLTENDGEGNGALLGSLELLGKLGLQFVGELGLGKMLANKFRCTNATSYIP